MTSKFFLAGFVGMLALALFGSLLYGVLFAGLFEANLSFAEVVMKDPPDLAWIGLAHVPFGILLTLVISWRGATSMQSGAVTGALLGLLMAASYDLSQYGTTNLWSLKLTLIEPFISMALVGLAGAAVGTVLGWDSDTGHEVSAGGDFG